MVKFTYRSSFLLEQKSAYHGFVFSTTGLLDKTRIFCLEGEGKLLVADRMYSLHPGSIVIINLLHLISRYLQNSTFFIKRSDCRCLYIRQLL